MPATQAGTHEDPTISQRQHLVLESDPDTRADWLPVAGSELPGFQLEPPTCVVERGGSPFSEGSEGKAVAEAGYFLAVFCRRLSGDVTDSCGR
jgi:hypothetical protein